MKAGAWNTDSPYFYAHSWGSSNSDVLMTLASCESDVFYADIPSGNTSVLFTRQSTNSGIKYKDQDGNYNQSADITISTNDKFTFSAWDGGDGKSTFTGGTYSAPTYTISFQGNGNTGGSTASHTGISCNGSQTLRANGFSRTGWTFTGWNTSAYGDGDAYAAGATISSITSNITLYAQWEKVMYVRATGDLSWWYNNNAWFAVWVANADESKDAWVKMTKAENCSDPAIYKATVPGNGYTKVAFVRKDPADETLATWDNKWNHTSKESMPTSNNQFTITGGDGDNCTGSWGTYSAPTLTISFNAGTGGSGTMTSISGITCDANQAVTANSFTAPSGYQFAGWVADVDVKVSGSTQTAGTVLADEVTIQNIRTDIALTAQWELIPTYTVTYNVNGGGSVTPTSATQASYGASVTLPTPTWSGYTFDGWYNNGTKIGNGGASYTPTANITLYAHWTDNISGKLFSYIDGHYGDRYKAFNGSNWRDAGDNATYDKTYTNASTGVKFIIDDGVAEYKNGIISTFQKYIGSSSHDTIIIPTGKIATVKILYGCYSPGNDLKLTVNGVAQNKPPKSLVDNQKVVTDTLIEITLDKQKDTLVLGIAKSTKNLYIARTSATITGYLIKYAPGANGSGDPITADTLWVATGSKALSSSTFTRAGYRQTGWATTDGGDQAYDLGGTYSTSAAITLYPVWTPTYAITVSTPSGGTLSASPNPALAGETVSIEVEENSGYEFDAWDVYKTGDSSTKVDLIDDDDSDGKTRTFTMPAYGVTIDASFTVLCSYLAAVSDLTCSAVTPTTLTYTWTKVTNASGYTAKLWDNSSCTGDAIKTVNINSGSTQTATFTGLSASTTYYCKVQTIGDGSTYCTESYETSAQSGSTNCTAISPALSYPFTTILVGSQVTPTLDKDGSSGTATYSSSATGKATVGSSDGIVTGVAAGSATITASIAASGEYCTNTATQDITVVSSLSGLIVQTLTTGDNAWGTPSAPATSTNITATTALTASSADGFGPSGNGNTSNGGQTAKILGLETGGDNDEDKYMELTFTVKKGKQLNVNRIQIPVQSVSSNTNTFKAVLSDDDDDTDDIVGTLTNCPNGKLRYIEFPSYGAVRGNATLKIYAWGWSNGYRFGKNIVIDGTFEDACTPISATGSAGTASVTGKTTATLPYTLTNTTNVASVTIKVYDSNNDLVQTYEDQTATTSGSCSATGLTAGSTYKYTVTPIASSGYCDGDESSKSSAFTMQYGVSYYGDSPTSGSAPTDASGYASGATITVAGNTGSMVKTGYTFRGWTYGGTFYLPGQTFTMPSSNVTLTAVWQTNGGGGAAETVVLTDFGNQFYTSGPRYGRAYVGSTSGDVHVIESNSSNNKGISDSTAIRVDYGKYIKVLGPNATVADYTTDSTFSGVSKIEFRWKLYNAGSPAPTTTVDVYVGNTKVASGIELTGKKTDPFVAISPITVSPAKNGAVKIVNTGTTTTHHLHIDSIAISYAGGATTNYNVSFANMTGFGGSASLPSTITGVPTGNKIVQPTDPTATGYTFDGWYPTAACNTSAFSFSGTIIKDTTIYAKWEGNKYTITLDNQGAYSDGTHEDGPANEFEVTYGTSYFTYYMVDPPSITGYDNFCGWYSEIGGGGDQIITYLGGLVDGATVYTDASGKWNYDGDVTVYAKWTMTLTGAYINKAGGLSGAITLTYNSSATSGYTPTTKTGYILDGYYTAASDGDKLINADGTLVAGSVTGYITDGKWTYTGSTPTIYAHWTPITYSVAFDPGDLGSHVYPSDGSMDPVDATYDAYVDMPANTFTREGYTFSGWSTTLGGDLYCGDQSKFVKNLTSTDGATVTLYALWSGNNVTVSFNPREGSPLGYCSSVTLQVGDTYSKSGTCTASGLPEPSAPSGYVFVGWFTAAAGGTQVTDETIVTTNGDHTLYARYEKKARIYFKNTLGWSKVYVTYDAYWDNTYGTGNNERIYHQMYREWSTDDVYYADVPASVLTDWKHHIAFNDRELLTGEVHAPTSSGNYGNYNEGGVVYRLDCDSLATMFVPTNVKTNNTEGNYQKNSAQYYSTGYADGTSANPQYTSGYWRVFNDVVSGYTLTYEKNGTGSWSTGKSLNAAAAGDSVFVYTVTLEANTQYNYALYKSTTKNNVSKQFRYGSQINSSTCTDLKLVCEPENGWMQTTVAGDYTFKLAMADDGHMYLSVEYPLAVNDYRVVYSYTKGEAQTFSSEYIKAKANAVDTISMFIHSGDSATSRSLYIQKCTAISAAGVPTWNTTYSAITLPSETAGGKTSGVYNFVITQNESSAATGESIGKYEGNYYIRSEAADGGWDLYKYRADNIMTLSEYSLAQTLSAPFSHYFCKYVSSSATDITYTVATEYSPKICAIQEGDATIGVGNKTLYSGKPASIRFTWNQETNGTFRSYLKSAQGDGNTRFLVMHGAEDDMIFKSNGDVIDADGGASLAANELLFSDAENWVYELAIKAKPGAKVSIIAQYNDVDRYLIGSADAWETIIDGETESTKYDIAAVYDFKTNRLITTWIPSGTIAEEISEVDVLIERKYQGGGTTITFGKATEEAKAGSISAKRIIGALKFEYDDLVGRVASWNETSRAKLMYFVSFPFDVNISDIFGLNTEYGEAFVVQHYNGAKRAKIGFFAGDGTETFWEELPVDTVMHANVGYVVVMDNDYMNGDAGHVWDNKKSGDHVYLYFPSANDPEDPIIINSDAKTVKLPEHKCTIDRTFNAGKLNHKYTDSNWNVMGVPIFQNHTGSAASGTPGAIFTPTKEPADTSAYSNPEIGYFYKWATDKSYTVTSAVGFTFKPMHSYLVQYAGNVQFNCAAPSIVAAPRRANADENYKLELQVLDNNETMLNRTYVELRENAVDSFALNEDLFMVTNNHAVNVYTFAGTYDVSANVLPVGNHVVPVGVIVKRAGTYTFSMPSNFSGTVTLVDTYTDARTNLALGDYEVNLPKGTNDERFFLEININKVPTAIDVVGDGGSLKDGKAHKYIMNDQMYILQNGIIYDARGARVK